MRRGFTLLELSVALVFAGLVAALFLKISDKSDTASCYVTTKKQIETIKDAVERFAMKHDRFPIPAVRNAGVEDKLYGREAATVADVTISITNNTPLTVIDDVNGALFGALPFQALGIPVENASDCWGNKYTYAVTKELTDPAKFLDNNTLGKLSIKTTPSITFLAEAGYAIISHGADELGAVKNNYAHATDRKWCNFDTSLIKTYNCSRTNNLISAEFNDGKDGAEKFFDDLIVYRGKPWRVGGNGNTNVYCWGSNSLGALGIGATAPSPALPTAVLNGPNDFKSVTTSGNYVVCGLTAAGKAYCWGRNRYGEVGNGTVLATGAVTSPTAVSGNHIFSSISAGHTHVCGLTTAGNIYCWGDGADGKLGYGGNAAKLVPEPVSQAFYAGTYTQVAAGYSHTCAIASTGSTYCWGKNTHGQLGVGSYTAYNRPQLAVAMPPTPVGLTFTRIAATEASNCAIASNGQVYCWGQNNPGGDLGALGTGDLMNTDIRTPKPVLGGLTFADLVATADYSCGISTGGARYCWGWGANIGFDGSRTDSFAPAELKDDGNGAYAKIAANNSYTCGLTSTGAIRCWGNGGVRFTGNYTALTFSDISSGNAHACAVTGTPTVFNGGWDDWTACDGACNGGLGNQTRGCLTGSCVGAPSQSCYNPAPCIMAYRQNNSDPWTNCPFGSTCPPVNDLCPRVAGGGNGASITSIGYVCTSPGKKRYQWYGGGWTAVGSGYCQSGDYDDASCP